jgi:hypothetical protein
MRIYIACGLTHVPRDVFAEHTNFVHALAAALRAHPPGHDVKYALVNSDPQLAVKPFEQRARLCYLWDREMVEEAELVIVEASFPFIGVGIEMQIAQQQGTPIILCFKHSESNRAKPVEYVNPDSQHHQLQIGEGFVSLIALGMPEITRVISYHNQEDGIKKALDAVEVLEKD